MSLVLRPLDVAVALDLALRPGPTFAQIATDLGISQSTAHEAVRRLLAAGLARKSSRGYFTNLAALEEFLVHGVRYAFPAHRARRQRGVPTAHAAPVLRDEFDGEVDPVVWPSARGSVVGASVEPLLDSAPDLAQRRPELYDLLALVDALRVGTARDREVAGRMLTARLEAQAT